MNQTNYSNPNDAKLIDQMIQRIPKIEESGLHSIHVGRDGITPDQRAIYGGTGLDGFYLACGLSGTGFKTSPAAGASLVELDALIERIEP